MNTEDYKEAFLEEAAENVNILNKALLAFEKNIDDLTPLNELFRAAHTLKGMSATMGYDKMAEFTHMLEEVMDKIRGGMLAPGLDVVNLLFKSIDIMQEFVENIKTKNVDFADGYRETIDRIKQIKGTSSEEIKTAPAKPQPAPAIPGARALAGVSIDLEIEAMALEEAAKQSMKVFKIRVAVARSCAFKNVRSFMVFRNLSEKGEIIKANPKAKDIEEGNFDYAFTLGYVTSLSADEVNKLISRIAEIDSVEVEEIKLPENPAGAPASAQEDRDEKQEHADEKKEKAPKDKKGPLSQSVRVNIEKLDSMMNLVGELVINKIRLDQITKSKSFGELSPTVAEFDRIIDALQIEVTDVRMLPVSHIFDRYPRVIRDLAADAGKQIEVEIIGGDIEIDRTVLEEINEPVMHLIRNSVAHGIEIPDKREMAGKNRKGVIRMSARRERNSVIIEVSDDGAGVNVEKVRKKAVEKGIMPADKIESLSEEEAVNLITLPGFSTVDKVNTVSGRGVGVDVVKTKVEAFGGIFKIENHPGEGMKSILKLPLTLAIIQALLVKAGGGIYAIPVIHTIETVELPITEIKVIQDRRVLVLRDEVVPVLSLAELIGKPRDVHDVVHMVIIESREKKIAMEVEAVIGQQEIAIKSLGEFLKYAKGFSGVTILGDGSISLIVDVQSLIEANIKLV